MTAADRVDACAALARVQAAELTQALQLAQAVVGTDKEGPVVVELRRVLHALQLPVVNIDAFVDAFFEVARSGQTQ
jgi:hypothetical protein